MSKINRPARAVSSTLAAATLVASAALPVAPSAQAQEEQAVQAALDAANIPGSPQLPDTGGITDKAKEAAMGHPLVKNALDQQTDTPEPANEESTNPQCAPVVMVAVPGTFETNRDRDPNEPVGAIADLTSPLRDKLGGDLSETYVNYAADAGVSGTAYATSIQNGATKTIKTIEDVQDRCDGSRVFLTGFSQGADVAGDVATMIGQKQTNVNPDTMAGVVLFSDPSRTENTNFIADSSEPIPGLPGGMGEAVSEMTDEKSIAQKMDGSKANGLSEALMGGDMAKAGEDSKDSKESASATSEKSESKQAGEDSKKDSTKTSEPSSSKKSGSRKSEESDSEPSEKPKQAGEESKDDGDVENHALDGNQVKSTGGITLSTDADTHVLAAGADSFVVADGEDEPEKTEDSENGATEVQMQEEVSDAYRNGRCGDMTFEDCFKKFKEDPNSLAATEMGVAGAMPAGNLMETECVDKPAKSCTVGESGSNLPTVDKPSPSQGEEGTTDAEDEEQSADSDSEQGADDSQDGDESADKPGADSAGNEPGSNAEQGDGEDGADSDNGAGSTPANVGGAVAADKDEKGEGDTKPEADSDGSPQAGEQSKADADKGADADAAGDESNDADGEDKETSKDKEGEKNSIGGDKDKSKDSTEKGSSEKSSSKETSEKSSAAAGDKEKSSKSNKSEDSSSAASSSEEKEQAGDGSRSDANKPKKSGSGSGSDKEPTSEDNALEDVEPVTMPAVAGGGVAGQREEDFGFMTGSVVSMCVPGDIVCSLPENSELARDLVQVGEKVTTNMAGVAKAAMAGDTRMGGLMAVEATNTVFSLSGLPPLKLSGDSIMALVSLVSGAAMLHAGDPTGKGAALIAAAVPKLPKVLPELYEQIKDLPAIIEALPDAADTFARNLGIDKILGRLSDGYENAGMNDLTDLAKMPSAAVSASIDLLNDNSGLMELATNPDYLKQGAHSADGFRSITVTDNDTNAADWYVQYVDAVNRKVAA